MSGFFTGTIKEFLSLQEQVFGKMNGRRRKDCLYGTVMGLVAANGKRFNPAPKLHPALHLMQAKECFQNAGRHVLLKDFDGFVYVEGYACGIIPVHHAWLTHVETPDLAYEITWPEAIPRRAYFGIPISSGYLSRVVYQSKQWGALDKMDLGWPLLTGEHRISEARYALPRKRRAAGCR